MFGILKKLSGAMTSIQESGLKAEHKDLMEAAVGVSVLIAYADGELEDEEVAKLTTLLQTTKAFAVFKDQIGPEVDRLCNRLAAGYRMGRLEVMKEIADIANDKEKAEMVLVLGIEVAFADGEFEPEEEKELRAIAQKLNLKLEDYL